MWLPQDVSRQRRQCGGQDGIRLTVESKPKSSEQVGKQRGEEFKINMIKTYRND